MTGDDITRARAQLARLWGLPRPLTAAQLGRVLQLEGRDPGLTIRRWERGLTPVPGLARVALGSLLAGFRPPGAPEASTPAPASPDSAPEAPAPTTTPTPPRTRRRGPPASG